MIVVGVLMTSRLAHRVSVRTVRERLGDDVEIRVVSWNRSDLPLGDVADTHVVVAPSLAGLPLAIQERAAAEPEDERSAQPTGELLDDEAGTSELLGLHDEPATSGLSTDARLPGPTPPTKGVTATARVRRRLGRLLRRAKRQRVARLARRAIKGGLARQFARACRSRPASTVLQDCDVVIALDVASIRTAWLVGRRNPHPAVVYGLDAGDRAVAAARRPTATPPPR